MDVEDPKLGDGRFLVDMVNRGWLLSPDLEDLTEEPLVLNVFWDDGSECRPRG